MMMRDDDVMICDADDVMMYYDDVVIMLDVMLESLYRLKINFTLINTTHKANVSHIMLTFLFLTPQISKRVDDYTENDVHEHNEHNNKEGEVKCSSLKPLC